MAGAKVVLVLTGGSPIALGEIADMVEAVVWVWYPGQEGGRALADEYRSVAVAISITLRLLLLKLAT